MYHNKENSSITRPIAINNASTVLTCSEREISFLFLQLSGKYTFSLRTLLIITVKLYKKYILSLTFERGV